MRTQERGITLIALVVTIVVLLILAAVTMSMLGGENGIITQALKAKEETEKAQKQEEDRLAEYEKMLNDTKIKQEAVQWTGEVAENFGVGKGTKDNPYKIESGEELALLAQKVNNGETQEGVYYKITNDINLCGIEWTPIGGNQKLPATNASLDLTNVKEKFEGTLTGNDKIIYGLNINKETLAGIGLIGILGEKGKIEGITIADGNVKGGQEVGGVVGISQGNIINCGNNATVTAADTSHTYGSGQMVGGIVGSVRKGTIEKCINTGNITGKNEDKTVGRGKYSGGIAGYLYNVTGEEIKIKGCINKGEIVTEYQQAGGIVGSIENSKLTLTIEDCTNTGKVIAKYVQGVTYSGLLSGGIVGWINNSSDVTITNCENKGEIVAEKQCAGGIAGEQNIGIIDSCTNTGKVIAEYRGDVSNSGMNSGGIVGWQTGGTITNSRNEGKIVAEKQQAGGITGSQDGGTITNSRNEGEIVAEKQGAGGITGSQDGGTINSCTNTGKVTVKYNKEESNTGNFCGGIVGWQTGGTVTNSKNEGEIVAEKQLVGGITGRQDAGTIENCTNTGRVIAKLLEEISGAGCYSGGITGHQQGGTITNSRNEGEIVAEKQGAGGIAGGQTAGTINGCSNTGKIIANSIGGRGMSGGIVGGTLGTSAQITNVYNSGEVIVESNDSGIDVAGGIVGYQKAGKISKAYNKGNIVGTEAVGGIVGQKMLAGQVEKTYYYTEQTIKGIGSESDVTTSITPVEDIPGKAEKVEENVNSFEQFLEWILNK